MTEYRICNSPSLPCTTHKQCKKQWPYIPAASDGQWCSCFMKDPDDGPASRKATVEEVAYARLRGLI